MRPGSDAVHFLQILQKGLWCRGAAVVWWPEWSPHALIGFFQRHFLCSGKSMCVCVLRFLRVFECMSY